MDNGGFAVGTTSAARSVALERAYVHDAYEHCTGPEVEGPTGLTGPLGPRTRAFLTDLEPGSLVADIGCGNGKYLNVNESVYTIGADRCVRLALSAREDSHQVLVCDNLALPFRDNCFDAVISIAVIHHFATAERRALAVRELARVLRIGGRLLLTVWAMEHEGRNFHSQDVLIPWNRPKTLSPPAVGLTSCKSLDSAESRRRILKENKFKHFLSAFSDSEAEGLTRAGYSPGSSSLSSPNETCYSFVRKALQKLAGSKKQKTWLPQAWILARAGHAAEINLSQESDKDARDLPIELRTIEDDEDALERLKNYDTTSNLSKSMTDVNEAEIHSSLLTSTCSLQSLNNNHVFTSNNIQKDIKINTESVQQSCYVEPLIKTRVKPKLIKQKKSINEDDGDEIFNDIRDLPDVISHDDRYMRKQCVVKQNSLNEEIMSTDRLQEKERVRKNIRKQASLNEEYLFRRPTFDSLKDSFMFTSANTAKKIQSIKNGLANRLKTTTNVENTTVINFVKMLQNWNSYSTQTAHTEPAPSSPADFRCENEEKVHERRHSKEDGSDSSKDSSLQSDTSVDSEDSFASVIFIPKADGPTTGDPMSPTPLSPGPSSPRLKGPSVPTSPRGKTSPGLPSPRIKQVIVRPPLSPNPTNSPAKVSPASFAPAQHFFGSGNFSPKHEVDQPRKPMNYFFPDYHVMKSKITSIHEDDEESPTLTSQQLLQEISKDIENIHKLTFEAESKDRVILQDVKPYPKITLQTVAELPEIPQFNGQIESLKPMAGLSATDRKRKERLRQFKEMLKHGSAEKTTFPIVRRQIGMTEPIAKTHPKLMSIELFNPETDDMDSDSSGPSSPDSVDSVISVVPDEIKKIAGEKDLSPLLSKRDRSEKCSGNASPSNLSDPLVEITQSSDEMLGTRNTSGSSSGSSWSLNRLSPGDLRFLDDKQTSSSESTSSLERISPGLRSKDRSPRRGSTRGSNLSLNRLSPNKLEGRSLEEEFPRRSPTRKLYDSASTSSTDSDRSLSKSDSIGRLANEPLITCKSDQIPDDEWNAQKDDKLTAFAEILSERLRHEIDQYSKRISEEDLDSIENQITAEIRRKKERESKQTLEDISDSIKKFEEPYSNRSNVEIRIVDNCEINILKHQKTVKDARHKRKSPTRRKIIEEAITKRLIEKKEENIINNNTDQTDRTKEEQENGNTDSNLVRSIESEPSTDSLRSSLKVGQSTDSSELEKMEISPESITATLRSGMSVESSDMTNQTGSLASLGSLASCNEWKTKLQRPLEPTLSNASQESGGSEGGAVTDHRYYHVFKKGELEQLIENYVADLHVISSYYDHSSWCIVAEKVQVWTI